jgi:uncharacterized protein (TIGR02145 family)
MISAGEHKIINSGEWVRLEGTATHPDGLAMTYQWSCDGGTISEEDKVQPKFNAPEVTITQEYSCTFTAIDSNDNTASSKVFITVNPPENPCNSEKLTEDTRDNQYYSIKAFGSQCWMTENINYEIESASWYYDDDELNYDYGKLYTWESAKDACPPGWHLPSISDYTTLEDTIGSHRDTWIDSDGWAGIYGGARSIDEESFSKINEFGFWWTSSSENVEGEEEAWNIMSSFNNDDISQNKNHPNYGYSVRCIKD